MTPTSNRSSLLSRWLFSRTCGMQTEQHVAGPVPVYGNSAVCTVWGAQAVVAYSHHWAYKSGITCSLDLLRTWVNVPCNECSGPVSLLGCHSRQYGSSTIVDHVVFTIRYHMDTKVSGEPHLRWLQTTPEVGKNGKNLDFLPISHYISETIWQAYICNGRLIGSHRWALDWYQFRSPWITDKLPYSIYLAV